jgi:Haem-NO-binding
MHGLVFASLRDYSTERLGDAQAGELWGDRVFAADDSYDDEWFAAQLDRLAAATGEPRRQVERGFGSYAARVTFAQLYPDYYAESGDVFTFLLGVEKKIHELVRATIPGARPPHLNVTPLEDVGVLISYTSVRGLCGMLEGLVVGTAEALGNGVAIEEVLCMHRGDPGCTFTVVASEDG